MQLIYLAPLHWSSFAQRPHMFVRWFHEQYQCKVLWVNPYPTRFPTLNDVTRIKKSPDACATEIPDWLTVITPSALPIEPLPGSTFVNAFLWKKSLRGMLQFASQDKTLLAMGKPSALALWCLEHLPVTKSFYDIMDDYPEFYSGLSRFSFAQREMDVVKRADIISVSSTYLMQKWSSLRSDALLIRNGLMPELFLPVEKHISNTVPVLGYVGTIAQWFDWEWLIGVAEKFPKAIVRIIGPIYLRPPENLPGNIEFYPACNHTDAIAAMKKFDVGLIPFKKNALTAGVDPIKFYEYYALGIPVVSTGFGEMLMHGKQLGVFLADENTTIEIAVNSALEFKNSCEAQQQFIDANKWHQRFSLFADAL